MKYWAREFTTYTPQGKWSNKVVIRFVQSWAAKEFTQWKSREERMKNLTARVVKSDPERERELPFRVAIATVADQMNWMNDESQLCIDWPRTAVRMIEAPHACLCWVVTTMHMDRYDDQEFDIRVNDDVFDYDTLLEMFRKNWNKFAPEMLLEEYRWKVLITAMTTAQMTLATSEWEAPKKLKPMYASRMPDSPMPQATTGDQSSGSKKKEVTKKEETEEAEQKAKKEEAKEEEEDKAKEEKIDDDDDDEGEDDGGSAKSKGKGTKRKWNNSEDYYKHPKSWNWHNKDGSRNSQDWKDYQYREKHGAWPSSSKWEESSWSKPSNWKGRAWSTGNAWGSGGTSWNSHKARSWDKGGGAWKQSNWSCNDNDAEFFKELEKEERRWRSWRDWQLAKKEDEEAQKYGHKPPWKKHW
eukprot:TRINITY_DN45405_c0_g1_i3.p1 TRINITY_DN45405_c0_g1~~TRINITY_DN45405_c0_g1_i3.p1  ORF type:complete len:412 (-),score=127.32 TRINITY_DN45405_c0_g1_i3:18-1253(-)